MDEQLVSKVKETFIKAGHKVIKTTITSNGRLGIIAFRPKRGRRNPIKLVQDAGAVPIEVDMWKAHRGYRVMVFRTWGQIGDAP